jgi:hypothetical protein
LGVLNLGDLVDKGMKGGNVEIFVEVIKGSSLRKTMITPPMLLQKFQHYLPSYPYLPNLPNLKLPVLGEKLLLL